MTSWIRPVAAQPLSVEARHTAEVEAHPRRPLVRTQNDGWSLDEQALVDKILAAVQLSDVSIVDEETLSAHVLVFDSSEGPSRQTLGDQIFWNLGPLKKLLHGTPPEIQQAKREVWNLLKQLKEEVGV